MKTDKALRRIASMRRNDHQPVAEYVAESTLKPDECRPSSDSRTSGAAPAQEPDRLVGIHRPHFYSVCPKIGIQ